MAQYFEGWSDDALGAAPAQWTRRFQNTTGGTDEIRETAEGERYLWVDWPSTSRTGLSFDPVDDDSGRADCEVYVEFTPDGTTDDRFGCMGRGSPDGGETLYNSENSQAANTAERIAKYVSGTFGSIGSSSKSPYSTGQRVAQRFRINGNNLRLKTWLASDPEPSSWGLETQDTDITAAGWVGLFTYRGNGVRVWLVGIGTDGDPAPTEPVDDDGEQFITESQRASFALDTRAPALQSGTSLTATRAEIALNTIAGTTRAGYSETGAVSQIALSSAPGTAQAGAAVEAAPLSLQLSARPGTVITGDEVPVVIQAARANLALSTQSGDVIRGHAIEGGAIAFSIESRPGTVQTADAVPFVVTGATADLSLSTESGDMQAGALLEGATVMLSLDPASPDIVRGHVIDGSPALFELLANAGDVFTGLVFATPITRTRAVDISPRYNVSIMTPRYSVRTIN